MSPVVSDIQVFGPQLMTLFGGGLRGVVLLEEICLSLEAGSGAEDSVHSVQLLALLDVGPQLPTSAAKPFLCRLGF